ncbi:hypothetical protein YERSI8AC_500005 [Enterobacterales bacterium 8AC]|nr:hypothetical protein YERSI8AC_500005 [Enterobacterales bacterium 8AC]
MITQSVWLTESELDQLHKEVGKPSLMDKTIELDAFMSLTPDMPGHGEAGGYEHNRHILT